MHLFRNALICASTVLECSCCRIHRYVAAPSNHKNTTGLKDTEQEEEPAGLILACSSIATRRGGGRGGLCSLARLMGCAWWVEPARAPPLASDAYPPLYRTRELARTCFWKSSEKCIRCNRNQKLGWFFYDSERVVPTSIVFSIRHQSGFTKFLSASLFWSFFFSLSPTPLFFSFILFASLTFHPWTRFTLFTGHYTVISSRKRKELTSLRNN